VIRSSTGALALVESPAQLLNVLELAYESPDLKTVPIAVLAPKSGPTRDQLRAMTVLAEEAGHEVLWYEPRLGLGGPAAYWALLGQLSDVEQLVIGDPFSGLVQSLFASSRPRPVTLVDDGTATLEFARRWTAGEPLVRWHRNVRPGSPRPLWATARDVVAGTARRRLLDGGLRIFTAMPVELPGVEVVPNGYAWVRTRFPMPEVSDAADLVGTSLVETGVVLSERYLEGVRSLVKQYRVGRYFAHRKEGEEKLAQITAMGVAVERPDLPLELVARRGPVGRTVLSFPSTVLHTLPPVLAGTGVQVLVCPIAPDWYRSGGPGRADDFLARVTSTAQNQHGLATAAC
jgi:hypothetical protein